MFEDITTNYYQKCGEDGSALTEDLLRFREINLRLSKLKEQKMLPREITTKITKPKHKRHFLRRLRDEFRDLVRPEETFEIWNQENLRTYRVHSEVKELNDDLMIDILTQALDEDFDDYDNHRIKELQDKLMDIGKRKLVDSSSSEYLLRTNGFEIIPHQRNITDHYRYHLHNLTIFLHLSMAKDNWDVAYKIFCLILRMPDLDIRNFWSLGVEILKQKAMRSNFKLFTSKQQRFFTWLVSFYVLKFKNPSYNSLAPIYKSGSLTRVPIYFITSLWSLLSQNDYKKVIDDVEGLILIRPYDTDGTLHFILTVSYLMQTTKLSSDYEMANNSSRSDLYLKITKNFRTIEKYLEKCDKLDFQYPRDLIDEQIKYITDTLARADNQDNENSLDSTDDYDNESDEDTNDNEIDMDETRIIDNDFIPTQVDQNSSQLSAKKGVRFAEHPMTPPRMKAGEFSDEEALKPSQVPSDEEIEFTDDEDQFKPSQIPSDEEIQFSEDEMKPSQIPSDEEIEFSDDDMKPSQIPSDEEIVFYEDDTKVQVPQSSQIEEIDFDFD
ncbi:hypothetical protein CLIB1444_03S04104 [[Candida] jaroonii]|uniref:Uncharacterized protein n=1 Tax=[Candida] jaroonii TaxID=467808 RepID=A0ACA9Y529_9ASCO|nr:hypothetical protein CLIB1444_03S04104 [[Candida] jaroonii]